MNQETKNEALKADDNAPESRKSGAAAALEAIPFVRAWKEKREEKKKQDPQERVNKMNSYFDRIVTPILIIALLLFAIFGIAPRLGCASCEKEAQSQEQNGQTFETRRELLLNEYDSYKALLEESGFICDEENDYAFFSGEGDFEIIEHYKDTNGNLCSLLIKPLPDGGEDDTVYIMYYNANISLVIVNKDASSSSAIFDNESFEAAPSDSDCSAVLELVDSQQLAQMLENYKACINSLFE